MSILDDVVREIKVWWWSRQYKKIQQCEEARLARQNTTVLRMCEDHPIYQSLKPVLLFRDETLNRDWGSADKLEVEIHTPRYILRPRVFFVVPRTAANFRLEWSRDPFEPLLSLADENTGKRYLEGALR